MKKILLIIIAIILIAIPYKLIDKNTPIESDKSFITMPNKLNIVATKIYNDRTTIEKMTNKSTFYFINNDFYNSITGLVATNTKKIIDISSYQGIIDWDKVKTQIDGVIVRIGFGSETLDSKLEYNIENIKRLNIPYGIYLYSYAENKVEATLEAEFTNRIINEYNLNPTLGIYYDIEEFYIRGNKVKISKEMYQKIIETYIDYLKEYDTSVYTYAKVYKYKFNEQTKKYVTWIAQYNYTFTYNENYRMWQYTDSESIDGIKGRVDMNVMFK